MGATRATAYTSKVVVVALSGLLLGWAGGAFFNPLAYAGGSCPSEPVINWSDAPQTVYDTDDGVDERNYWNMHAGRDFARSLACDDGGAGDAGIEGQKANDDVGGGSGDDWIEGNADNDDVYGGLDNYTGFSGGDHLFGMDGADEIYDVSGPDGETVTAGGGPDVINVQDGDSNDLVFGDGGSDTCYIDGGDTTYSC